MVEVICDTSFLIHLATKRIRNIDNLDIEIGSVSFVVPQVVRTELTKLQKISKKKQDVDATIDFIKNFKTVSICGNFADKELIDYVKNTPPDALRSVDCVKQRIELIKKNKAL